jgi:hypothetical protein
MRCRSGVTAKLLSLVTKPQNAIRRETIQPTSRLQIARPPAGGLVQLVITGGRLAPGQLPKQAGLCPRPGPNVRIACYPAREVSSNRGDEMAG